MSSTTLERIQARYGAAFAGNVAEDFMMIEQLAKSGEPIATIDMMMRFRYAPDTIRAHLMERGLVAAKRSVNRAPATEV